MATLHKQQRIEGYYTFDENDYHQNIEARFWSPQGKQIAIVACITKGIDWAAYIGADAPNSYREDDTLKYVSERGCKLSREDAKYFFPGIKLPYRG